MVNIIYSNFNNVKNHIKSNLDEQETLIITSQNKIIKYKSFFSNYNNVSVTSLKTLIYKIYNENINKYPILNNEMQLLYFIKAIKNCNEKLINLNSYSFDIVNDIIDIYVEEVNYNLIKTNYKNENINDIETIIKEYLSLINNLYIDEQILYKEVYNFIIQNKMFEKVIIADVYHLNSLEKEIIYEMLNNNSYIYFLSDGEISGLEVHNNLRDYIKNKLGEKYIEKYIENPIDDEKQFIINNLYNLNNKKMDQSNFYNLYGSSDLYDEVVFVANMIAKLVQTKNYRYKDFAIVSNMIDEYNNYFDLLFNDNNIPYHKEENINYNFFNYVLSLLYIINNDINKEHLITILKSGFYDLNELDIIEIMNDDSNLLNINNSLKLFIDENILNPLNNINKTDKTVNILRSFYNYLEQFSISAQLGSENANTWNEFIKILDNIYEVYKDDNITVSEIIEIVKFFTNNINLKNNYIDEVYVGNPSNIISLNYKVVFYIGVNEGVVPSKDITNLLLSSYIKDKYYLNYPKFKNILTDKMSSFWAFTSALDETYITYHKVSQTGSKVNKAPIIEQIKSMYKVINVIKKEDFTNLVYLSNFTYNNYLKLNNLQLKNYLKEYYKNNEFFSSYNRLINYVPKFYNVDKANFGHLKEVRLSPSSIDTYNYCAFQYFCKYILKLSEEEQFKYDNRIVGTYIHYMYEKLIINGATKDNVNGFLNFYKTEFIKKEKIKVTPIVDYMFDKLNLNILKLWPYIYEEIEHNKFKPFKLELNILEEKEKVIFDYEGIPIKLSGIIDRVDIYNDYVRIIDYKTGVKKINLNEFLNGINLQLFIYLLYIKLSNKNLIPSAMFYTPSLINYDKDGFDFKKHRYVGLLMNDNLVIEALGGDNINNYVDAYRYNKLNKDIAIQKEDMEYMLNFTKEKIIKTAGNILNGHIKIEPIKDLDKCKYCPYQSICGIEQNSTNYRTLIKYDKEMVWKIIRGDINEVD